MDDRSKTKAQLIAELEALRAEVAALKHQPEALNSCDPKLCEPLIQYQNLLAGFFSEAAQSNVGLFILNTNLRFVQINQTLADINGYSIEEHKGRFVSDLLPDLAPTLIPLLQALIETGQPISNFEISGFVSHQPDTLRHWLTSYFPLLNQAGSIIAVGGIVFEITEYKQTLEVLRQSEANLRMAQQIAHVGSWHWDRAAKTVFWSEEMYRIHGCDPTQPPPQGTDLEPYIHPDDLATYQALTERALAGYPFEVDLRIIRPNGDVRYVETRGEPGVFNEQGELQHLFGTVLDVTERKRVEEALRKSEFALREAQRLAHVGSWQWTRETGIVWSEEIYRIHGLDPSQPNPPSHAEARKNIHPDDLDIHEAIYTATIAGHPYEFDLRIVRPDGEIRYIEARGVPAVRNEQGDMIELFGTVMDVTDRKRVEAQLRASEANLARAQKIANIASWEYDIATQTCIWSEELYRIHQIDPSLPAPVGDAMDRLIHPDDLWIDRELIKAPLMAGQSYETDLRIVHASGEVRHIETRGEPVFNTQSQIVGFTGTVIDITDRKRIEERLRRNEAEIRAILTAIPDMLIRVKKDGTRLFISAGSLKSYNNRGLLVGGSIFDTLPPEIAEQRMTYVRKAIETGERQIYEYEITIDSDRRHEEARIVAINDEEALIVVRDITNRKRAEAALKDSETRFRMAVENAPDVFTIYDSERRFQYVNQHGLERTGWILDTFLGKRDEDLFPPEVTNSYLPLLLKTVETRTLQTGEATIQLPQQEPYTILVKYVPILNEQGNIHQIFGITIDITDRKRMEEALREQEAENLSLIQAIPDLLIRMRRDGTYLSIQKSDTVQLVSPHKMAPGATVFDTLPSELAQARMHHVQLALRTGDVQSHEYQILVDEALCYEEARIIPHSQDEVLVIVRDETDRKRAEARLQESNRRWESLLDQVQLMVVGLNAQGYVEYVNPFFLEVTEYAEVEVLNQHWFKTFVATIDQQTSEQHFINLLERRLPYSYYQSRIVTRTKEERFIVWNNTVLQNTNGEVIGTISIGEDMTEQRKLERLKNEFISVVSHELRTPLTSMQVALSLLDEHLVDPTSEDGQGMIHVANEGVDRLVRLVNDILDLERLESGKLRIKKQRCNPADVLHTAIDQMKDLANQSSITIKTKVDPFSAYADSDRLVQVLTNLLSNAIRFSPLHSTIEILVEHPPQPPFQPLFLQFSVKDQGRGIPADQLDRIFERFQQVDASDSREKSGTGLGLAICRSIIHQHGGQIWAESTLGEGSTFYFTVPVLEDNDGNETHPAD